MVPVASMLTVVVNSPFAVVVLTASVVAFQASILISLGWWVARDASARGFDHTLLLGTVSALTPIGLPYYLYMRYRTADQTRQRPASKTDRLLSTWASAGVAAFLTSAVLAPPDPFSQLFYELAGLAILLPCAYFLVYRGGYRRIRGSNT
ncbi:hypothetical protein ACFQJC_02725 [Haloferax namakaokahaiae]|uniref:Uncharacterized protein n=1 Tax=Haloferax namakaokahaiae TaxID=1748331 RepID=A0ABD5ZB34_9EURY